MNLDEIRQAVFAARPQFAEVVSKLGSQTLLDYYAQDFPNLTTPSDAVAAAIQSESAAILGSGVGKQARASVLETKWTNTADHHGLLCHPYFYSTSLARSHKNLRTNANTTVSLTFGGISLGNDSFPRGFFFHDQNGRPERVFFKSLADRSLPVYSVTPTTPEILKKEIDRVTALSLSPKAKEKLIHLLSSFISEEKIWNQQTYSAQLTAMNSILWKELFGSERGEFVHLEIDSVVNRLLLEKHLLSDTHIYNLLFDPTWRNLFEELFKGVTGSHTEHSGTCLFWYIDPIQKRRRGLSLVLDHLVTKEGDVSIALSPENIAAGLLCKNLMPSTALLLIIVHGVESLTCGGGSSQLSYLPHILNQWNTLLGRVGISEPLSSTEKIFCGHSALFQLSSPTQATRPLATLIDCFLCLDKPASTIDSALESVTLSEAVDAMLPTIYTLNTRDTSSLNQPCNLPIIPLS